MKNQIGILNTDIDSIKNITKEQFQALYQISNILNSASYEEVLIEQSLDWVIKSINAERGLFAKYETQKNDFSIIAARNIKEESLTDVSEFSSGVLHKVIDKKESLVYHDVQSDPQLSQFESIRIQQIKSIVGIPIFRDSEIFGVIIVDSSVNRKEFTEENLVFLNFFSNLVSLGLEKIIDIQKLRDENQILLNRLEESEEIPDMIGKSNSIKRLGKLIHKIAQNDATVLILGESGTGKDLVAKAIHKLSKRKDFPYLAQFCGSIPDSLLESELFGYKKGAFTGAASDKKGLLEVADKGTFFLDEIADISEALQAKLLRVLENKEIIRLGDTHVRNIDLKIIAATNKNLQKLVKEGKFREDLFYRLNVFPLEVPPLRERRDDIHLLVDYFLNLRDKSHITLDTAALKKLESYNWPGNIRQLLNVLERALIICDGNKITVDDIVLDETENSNDIGGTLKEIEKRVLIKRLEDFSGNRTKAAESLGVSVRWIQLKLKEMETDT